MEFDNFMNSIFKRFEFMEKNYKEALPVMCIFGLFMSHTFYRCLRFVFELMNIQIADNMSFIWFGLLFLAIIVYIRYCFQPLKLLLLIGSYVFYIVNYCISSPEARQYYTHGDVMTVLLIYIPICVLMVNKNNKWEILFQNRFFIVSTDALIILSFLAKYTYSDHSDYMSFSYDLLPAWNIVMISAIYYNKKIQWLFLVIGLLEGFIFGARGPILWFAVCMFLISFYIINNKKKTAKHIIVLIISILGLYIFIDIIIPFLMNSTFLSSSYVLKRINFGSLTDNSDRKYLYVFCRDIISNMGINVYGLFYDRTVLPSGMYAHNFIYEILLSFGWFFGTIIIGIISILTIKAFMNNERIEKRIIATFFICSFFLRYIVSGSIFDEGNFIIYITVLSTCFSSSKNCSDKNLCEECNLISKTCYSEAKSNGCN